MEIEERINKIKELSFKNKQRGAKTEYTPMFAASKAKKIDQTVWAKESFASAKNISQCISELSKKTDIDVADVKTLLKNAISSRSSVAKKIKDHFIRGQEIRSELERNKFTEEVINNYYSLYTPKGDDPKKDESHKIFFENYSLANGKKEAHVRDESGDETSSYIHHYNIGTEEKPYNVEIKHEYSVASDGKVYVALSSINANHTEKILEKIASHLEKALKWDGADAKELVNDVSKIKWCLIQSSYTQKGISSIADYVEKAIYEHHDLMYFPNKPTGMSRDFLGLLSLSPEAYAERYEKTLSRLPVKMDEFRMEVNSGLQKTEKYSKDWKRAVIEAGSEEIHRQ